MIQLNTFIFNQNKFMIMIVLQFNIEYMRLNYYIGLFLFVLFSDWKLDQAQQMFFVLPYLRGLWALSAFTPRLPHLFHGHHLIQCRLLHPLRSSGRPQPSHWFHCVPGSLCNLCYRCGRHRGPCSLRLVLGPGQNADAAHAGGVDWVTGALSDAHSCCRGLLGTVGCRCGLWVLRRSNDAAGIRGGAGDRRHGANAGSPWPAAAHRERWRAAGSATVW